jgi:hypothetical protein
MQLNNGHITRPVGAMGRLEGKLFRFEKSRTPLHIETVLLRRIRKELGMKPALTRSQMRGVGGATEKFHRSQLSTRTVYRWVRAMLG